MHLLAAPGPTGPQKIVSVAIHDTGHAIIRLDDSMQTESCHSPGNKNFVVIRADDTRYKSMYAMALAGFTTGKKVNSWVLGCVDLWGNGSQVFPKAHTLEISD